MTDEELIKAARRLKLPKYMYDTPSARLGLRRFAADMIPTNWLHPVLTGPDAALKGNGPWGCPDIVRMFLALKGELSYAADGVKITKEKS